jgi:hypothetical protein
MPTVRIEMNSKGMQALLKSSEVQDDLKERANRIAAAAGKGFEVQNTVGKTRAHSSVNSMTPEAWRAEAKDKKLTRAIDAGRD